MSPLLYDAILSTRRTVMNRFVKSDILNSAKNTCRTDVSKQDNLIGIKEIGLGCTVRNAFRRIKPNSLDLAKFCKECRDALIKFCNALTANSPLLYLLTKGISCFDPSVALNPNIRRVRLTRALDYFVKKKWLSGQLADRIQNQYNIITLSEIALFDDKMKNYLNKKKVDRERLDDSWLNAIPKDNQFDDLQDYLKIILILSHGNAFAEKGFSINKGMLIENQSNESLIAQRQVFDTINYQGGIHKIDINKKRIHAARNAHSLYEDSLKKKNDEATAAAKKKKKTGKRKATKKNKRIGN